MPTFFVLRCRPTCETFRAGTFAFCFIVVLGAAANFVPDRFLRPAAIAVAIFYVAMYFASLSFARRQQSLDSLGITGGHWVIAVIAGIVLGTGGVLGVVDGFPGGTFIPTAGFVEAVVFFGYFQFRLRDAFGAPIAIIGTALA